MLLQLGLVFVAWEVQLLVDSYWRRKPANGGMMGKPL